jgi:hypothetical protein
MRLNRDQIELVVGTTGIILFGLALVIVRNLRFETNSYGRRQKWRLQSGTISTQLKYG